MGAFICSKCSLSYEVALCIRILYIIVVDELIQDVICTLLRFDPKGDGGLLSPAFSMRSRYICGLPVFIISKIHFVIQRWGVHSYPPYVDDKL